ncbi:MAG: hypothetical protein ACPGO7_01470 [Alphaproteobacteria bacterium]
MATVTKGLINNADLDLYDGVNDTVSRITSTGGLQTYLPINCYVDVLGVYGNSISDRTSASIARALARIGTRTREIVLAPGTWTISADTTIPSNVTLRAAVGATITIESGITLTINSQFEAGAHKIFTINGTLNMVGTIDSRWFGTVGDDSTDETTSLTDFFNTLGSGYFEVAIVGPRVGYIPPGKYPYANDIPGLPANTTLKGVTSNTVLKPGASTTKGLVVNGGCTVEGIVLDGISSASTCEGLSIGETNLDSDISLKNVYVARFDATDQLGAILDNTVTIYLETCRFIDNWHGLKGLNSGATTPAVTHFNMCEFTSNDGRGCWIESGQHFAFYNCNFELNGQHGLYVHNAAAEFLKNVNVNECYFEANHQSTAQGAARNALYQAVFRCIRPRVRNAEFDGNSNEAKAVQFEACTDAVLDHCETPLQDDTVSFITSGGGNIINWPLNSGAAKDRVSIGSGTTVYFNGKQLGTFSPEVTFSTPGDLSLGAYSAQIGEYEYDAVTKWIRGHIAIEVVPTHTTASGDLRITGLPYQMVSTSNFYSDTAVTYNGVTKASYTNFNFSMVPGQQYALLTASGSGVGAANTQASDVPSGGTFIIRCSFQYQTV